MPGDDLLRGGHGIAGQTKRGGHVVDRAARNVPQRRALVRRKLHQTRDCLVERAVSAGADDQIEFRTACDDLPREIPRRGSRVDGDVIAAGREDLKDLHQRTADLRVPGIGIDEKQHFLFHIDRYLKKCAACCAAIRMGLFLYLLGLRVFRSGLGGIAGRGITFRAR